jgi:IclR family transcriptional regulator, acetate operon repressor
VELTVSLYEMLAQTLNNGLSLLELLAESGELRLADAATALGVSKPTAFRLLAALQTRGYVEHMPATRSYRLGSQLQTLAAGADRSRLIHLAAPAMARLRDAYGETVNLAVLRRDRIVYEEIFEGSFAVRMSARVGDELPVHATALGKAILAVSEPGARDALLGATPYQAFTDRTVTERPALDRELARIAGRGWGSDYEETELGAACVAAAIINREGHPVGGLSVAGLAARITRRDLPALGSDVAAECAAISAQLGWRAAA